jgi:hypothetical protein
MVIRVVEFLREGYKIRNILAKNQLQSNEILRIGVVSGEQSKNVNNKECAPKFAFFNEK